MDEITQFCGDPINAQLVALLEGAPISDDERNGWFDMLPLLNDSEKKRLIANLQAEILDFEAQEERVLTQMFRV